MEASGESKPTGNAREKAKETMAIIKQAGRAIKYSRNVGDDSFRRRGNRLH